MITSKLYSLMAMVGLSAAVAMLGLGCESCGCKKAPETHKAAACQPATKTQPSCAAPESSGLGAQPGGTYYESTNQGMGTSSYGTSGGSMDTGTSGYGTTPGSSGGMNSAQPGSTGGGAGPAGMNNGGPGM